MFELKLNILKQKPDQRVSCFAVKQARLLSTMLVQVQGDLSHIVLKKSVTL
jgi:hypothetical protein